MISLDINADISRHPWTDSDAKAAVSHGMGKIERICRLTEGCVSGRSTVSVFIRLPDGNCYIAETTMALFLNAAKMFEVVEKKATHEADPDAN